jgi:enoyl-CoA hydratase
MTDEPTVLTRRDGRIGWLTLNRPAALNALDLGMIRAVHAALRQWQDDDGVAAVLVDGAGERAFCAGGDIAVVHRSAGGDHGIARTLWREEYGMDAAVARYPKPVIALMDGITMGGGLGIAGHASIRVVTERAVLAMPEVAIGLSPDVGGLYLLARAPGEIGVHMALTAARVGPADALHCGLADHDVASGDLAALRAELAGSDEPVAAVVARHARPGGPSSLREDQVWIDACYRDGPAEEIVERLRARPEPGAAKAADVIESAAPTAVKVTLRAARGARAMTSVEQCLRQDYRLITRFLAHPDLREGIRAAVIDKDRTPRWRPARLTDVPDADVEAFFAPLSDELVL